MLEKKLLEVEAMKTRLANLKAVGRPHPSQTGLNRLGLEPLEPTA